MIRMRRRMRRRGGNGSAAVAIYDSASTGLAFD